MFFLNAVEVEDSFAVVGRVAHIAEPLCFCVVEFVICSAVDIFTCGVEPVTTLFTGYSSLVPSYG